MRPIVSLEVLANVIIFPCWESNPESPDRPALGHALYSTEPSRLPTLIANARTSYFIASCTPVSNIKLENRLTGIFVVVVVFRCH